MARTGKGPGLTVKQEAFVQEYLKHGNASQAYRAAYDAENMKEESVWRTACVLLKHVKVASRLQQLQTEIASRHGVTVDKIVQELAKLGFSNMHDYMQIDDDGVPRLDFKSMSRDKAAAIAEMTVEEFTAKGDEAATGKAGVRRVKFKLHDKRAPLVDLGKHLGMFKEIVEMQGKGGGPIQIEEVSDMEAARRIAYMLGRAVGRGDAVSAKAKEDADTGQ